MREYYPLIFVGALVLFLSLCFLGTYLIVRRKSNALYGNRNMKDGEILRRLMRYALPHKKSFVLVFFLMLFSIAYDVISPMIVGYIEETVKAEFELRTLWIAMIFFVSLLIVSVVCTYFQSIVLQKTGQKILSAVREDLFVHIESLSHAQLNETPVGKLVTRVVNDTNSVSMMFTNIFVTLLKNFFVIAGVLVAMLFVNLQLTVIVLVFVPFIVLFTFIFQNLSRRASRRVNDGTTDLNTFLSENLSGMKITQIFNREERKKEAFEKKSRALGRSKQIFSVVYAFFQPMTHTLYNASVLCLFYFGAKGYISDTTFFGTVITAGMVVTFYIYIAKFFGPIQNLAEQFNLLQTAFASAEKIFTVFNMKPDLSDSDDAVELDSIRGEIEFRDVWFAYHPGEWVLEGVSFKVEAGQTVAFVGATGSGKSTILGLICRNYDVQKGQILVDGIDVRKIKIASLRRHFGQMLQDVFLFSGTVRSNLVLREDRFTDEEILEACRYVNADSFILKLERGLDETVRERGNNFSAGQRQLLSFARTVIHKPSVMILDEATANIDTETELLIQDSLEKMMSVGTMLIVAHRLSTVQKADNIIVLSKGRILEQGTHQELLHRKGRYYQLYTLQAHRSEIQNS